MWLWIPIGLIIVGMVAVQRWRLADQRSDDVRWARLKSLPTEGAFSQALIADLPEPARRYFRFSVKEGTPLYRSVTLRMDGQLSLGSKANPSYMPMHADQILAAQRGFIWRPSLASGLIRISGSDGYYDGRGWTQFWLWSLVPIVRAGGTPDFAKSAAARGIAEAVFWLPTALLPSANVHWEAVDADTARVVVDERGEHYAVDIKVADDGHPVQTVFQRWSRENPDKVWRYQPIGAEVQATRAFGGLHIASKVRAGNNFGSADYFPFYIATITDADYGDPSGRTPEETKR
jgi:hypothetical protein